MSLVGSAEVVRSGTLREPSNFKGPWDVMARLFYTDMFFFCICGVTFMRDSTRSDLAWNSYVDSRALIVDSLC